MWAHPKGPPLSASLRGVGHYARARGATAPRINTRGALAGLHPSCSAARPGLCSRPQRQASPGRSHATSTQETEERGDRRRRYGEGSVLREDGPEEGAVDAGGGQGPRRPHPALRPRQLARAAQASRATAVRQELPAPVDQLPAPGHQARQLQQGGGGRHHPPPRGARQQVVRDRRQAAGPDGQRDQERLAHAPQEAAGAGADQAGGGRGRAGGRRQEAQARGAVEARRREEGTGVGQRSPGGRRRPGVARAVRLVVGDRVVRDGAGQHGELAGVPQGGELHLVPGRRGVPDRRELLVGDAVDAARELRRPHGALRRVRRRGHLLVRAWRRRGHGLLAQSVHGVRRRAARIAADLESAREFSLPWLIDSSFFFLSRFVILHRRGRI